MMLVSYRTRGSDAAWRAGIAHEEIVVDVTASRLHRTDEVFGQGDLSVRGLLEQGPSSGRRSLPGHSSSSMPGTISSPLTYWNLAHLSQTPTKLFAWV